MSDWAISSTASTMSSERAQRASSSPESTPASTAASLAPSGRAATPRPKGRLADPAGDHIGKANGADIRVGLVASRFNGWVTERLVSGARACLSQHGVAPGSVTVSWVPGAFELPLVAWRLAVSGRYHAVICLGAVVRGDTDHYEHVASQAAAGIQRVQLDTGVPVLFGVLTTDTIEQALERAGDGNENKGFEAALAALEMADLLQQLPAPQGAR